jgi:hypothetical protein
VLRRIGHKFYNYKAQRHALPCRHRPVLDRNLATKTERLEDRYGQSSAQTPEIVARRCLALASSHFKKTIELGEGEDPSLKPINRLAKVR